MPKICKAEEILNPISNRCIKKNGQLYKKLKKNGTFPNEIKEKQNNEKESKQKKVAAIIQCPEGKVLNMNTKRCITIGGILYKKLLKAGINFHDADVALPVQIVKNLKCKNESTFFYMIDSSDIPKDDLLRTPEGYCFSIVELMSWLNSSNTFNNKNPHDNNLELFKETNIHELIKHPELKKKVEAYFAEKKKDRMHIIDILHKHMDILYNIGRAGRICYYNSIVQGGTESSPFEYAIEAIISLSEMIDKLNKKEKDVIENMLDISAKNNLTLKSLIFAANNGTTCIHGVGRNLIVMFMHYFLLVEQKYKNIYEPLKTGLYFERLANNKLLIKSMNNWFVPDPNSYYYKTQFGDHIEPIIKKYASSSIYLKNLNKEGKTSIFNKLCQNEQDISGDEWKDISEWKKFMTGQKYCYDLFTLINLITDQLNAVKNSNPYPTYPKDAYTNKILTKDDLTNLRRIIQDNYIGVSKPLELFLNTPGLWKDTLKDNEYFEWRNKCTVEFEKSLRYVRINKMKSSNLIDGYWDIKATPRTTLETLIYEYLSTADETKAKRLRSYTDQSIPLTYYYRIDETKPPSLSLIKAY